MSDAKETSAIPAWINDELMIEIGFKALSLAENGYETKIEKTEQISAPGENYSSSLHRVAVKYVTKDKKEQNLHTIVKSLIYVIPQMRLFNQFGREVSVYEQALPRFKKLWMNQGVNVDFAPAFYKWISGENDVMVLEDGNSRGYKVVDRRAGLDLNHIHLVLDKLARFHAASVVDFEKNGPLTEDMDRTMFVPEMKPFFEQIFGASKANIFAESVNETFPALEAEIYLRKVNYFRENAFDILLDLTNKKNRRFVVLSHGDMWINNVLFSYDGEGKPIDLLFIDFQMSVYQSPAFDLFYFLITSPQIDIKVDKFDYLINFYHEKLAKYLEQLGYPKKIPTLKDIHQELLTNSIMSIMDTVSTLAGSLVDPIMDATMENFLGDGAGNNNFMKALYNNPRYKAHIKKLLPFFNSRGWLDVANY